MNHEMYSPDFCCAIMRGGQRCRRPASKVRGPFDDLLPLCGIHAIAYDEQMQWHGDDEAAKRIKQGTRKERQEMV